MKKASLEWQYFDPKFQSGSILKDYDSPWSGHRFFVYDFLRNIKPKTVVELGTFYGTSFFAMCQAAKDSNLKSKLHAVDTWKGDKHAGFYKETVYQTVQRVKKKFYDQLAITLHKKTFDEALASFKAKSIDLLHIDGLHTYEAVKHDFETWLPKMSPNGVIIMHDIVERQADFGVYKLWKKLQKKYTTIEFHHSHGLGVVILNPKLKEAFTTWKEPWFRYYAKVADYERGAQQFTFSLKEHDDLLKQVQEKEKQIILLKHDLYSITKTNFFKLWQAYVKVRNSLFIWKPPNK